MDGGTSLQPVGDAADLGEGAALLARRLSRPGLAPAWIACAGACLDVPALTVAFWFAQYAGGPSPASFAPWIAAGIAASLALLATLCIAVTGGYAPRRLRSAPRAAFSALVAALPAAAALVAAGPATVVPLAMGLLAVLIPTRIAGAVTIGWAVETGLVRRRAVLAGGGAAAADLLRTLAARPDNDIEVWGVFDDRDDDRSPAQILAVPKLGGYDDLIAFARRAEIDMIIVTLPMTADARINWLLDRLRVLPVDIRLSAMSRDFAFRDGAALARAHSFAPGRRLTKRAFDLGFATMLLAVALPAMALTAIAVRLDSPGPVLFRQRRHGYNDRVIEVWKFRTLRHDAADPDARTIVTAGDPRVTRVGRFLRRSSLDELPQLFNVIAGHLSLVGPRPHALDARSSASEPFARMVEGYSARHRLPPGITGLAQISGLRGEVDGPEALRARIAKDLWYIENWSIWLDLAILARTPLSLLDTRGAY